MIETEQKIILSRESLEKVFNALAPAEVKRKHHPRAYFDTLDMQLHHRKTALRIQTKKNGKFKQTIKTAHESDGASLVRSEWDMVIDGDRPDFSGIDKADILNALGDVDPEKMVHIFTSDVKRRFFDLDVDGRGVVEVAFDLGEIYLPNGDIREEMCEIEVELKSGDPEIIDVIAKRILAMADDAKISMVSKAERGFDLYQKHRL